MYGHREAIIRLLRDDDLRTVELVKEQLTGAGARAIDDLRDLLSVDDPVVRWQVRQMLNQIDLQEARRSLPEICREFPREGGLPALENAAFLLARALLPGLNPEEVRKDLDAWGEQLSRRLQNVRTDSDRALTLSHFLGRELGFQGDSDEAYAVPNALLPKVVESRMGLPITLALVYLLVGARAGLEVEAVTVPGYFLIACEGVLIDPFAQGRILGNADVAALLARQNLPVNPESLHPETPRSILRWMMTQLHHLYLREEKTVASLLERWLHDLDQPTPV